METFVAAKKYQRALLTTYVREPMPERIFGCESLSTSGIDKFAVNIQLPGTVESGASSFKTPCPRRSS
jgi:hypothetical protein